MFLGISMACCEETDGPQVQTLPPGFTAHSKILNMDQRTSARSCHELAEMTWNGHALAACSSIEDWNRRAKLELSNENAKYFDRSRHRGRTCGRGWGLQPTFTKTDHHGVTRHSVTEKPMI